MRPLAAGAFVLPGGIEPSDLAFISQYVAIIAAIFAVIGVAAAEAVRGPLDRVHGGDRRRGLCRHLPGRRRRHLLPDGEHRGRDRDVMLDLMAIAGLAGLAVALFVGRRLTKASRALSSARCGASARAASTCAPAARSARPSSTRPLRRARRRARAPRPARARTGPREPPPRARRLGQPRPAYAARRPAGDGRGARGPGGHRTARASYYHSQIRGEVDRLAVMIDDLFELSRIHAGALRLSRARSA